METDNIKAFTLLANNMYQIPPVVFAKIFKEQMCILIKKRIKQGQTKEQIAECYLDEPVFIQILSYCQITPDMFTKIVDLVK